MGKLIVVLVLVAAIQVGWEWKTLPEVVASHFDMHGAANGTMPRGMYCVFHASIVALLAAVFGLMPSLIRRMPVSLINLPHREYWLASSRAEASMDRLDSLLKANGVITLTFIAVVMGMVHAANLGMRRVEPALLLPLLLAYLVAMGWNTIRLFRAFPAPPV